MEIEGGEEEGEDDVCCHNRYPNGLPLKVTRLGTEGGICAQHIWLGGWAKADHRKTCTYNYQALRDGLPVTFDEIKPVAFVRRALDHCFRFMDGYRKGLTRPVPDYLIKQETMMRFKRSK